MVSKTSEKNICCEGVVNLHSEYSVQKFIRYSAALTCFSYNCPLANITNLDLVPYFGDHIAQLS